MGFSLSTFALGIILVQLLLGKIHTLFSIKLFCRVFKGETWQNVPDGVPCGVPCGVPWGPCSSAPTGISAGNRVTNTGHPASQGQVLQTTQSFSEKHEL